MGSNVYTCDGARHMGVKRISYDRIRNMGKTRTSGTQKSEWKERMNFGKYGPQRFPL